MEAQIVDIDSVHETEANARLHTPRNLEAIRESLCRWGQVEPLVVRTANNEVIGGNGRLSIMRALGWGTVDVVFVDLTEKEAAALAIALNRSGDLALWDVAVLEQTLLTLDDIDPEVLGWTPSELEALLAHTPDVTDDAPIDIPPGSDASKAKPIFVTPEQRETINQAIAQLRASEGDDTITEGRCVELMAGEWLGGN